MGRLDDNGGRRQRFEWGDKGTIGSVRKIECEAPKVFQDVLHMAFGNRVWRSRGVVAGVAGYAG